MVCEFLGAAETKHHKLGDYCLPVLEAGSPKSRCRQGWFLLRLVEDCSMPLLDAGSLRLSSACRCLSSPRVFYCVCLCVQFPLLVRALMTSP